MAALLDLHPDTAHRVLVGLAEIEAALDRMQHPTAAPLAAAHHAAAVTQIERAKRRLDAVKLGLVASVEKTGAPADAGFTGTQAWVAKTTTVSRTAAAREVALAKDLHSGHDATSAAPDQGLVSPAYAAVILRAGRDLPETLSEAQRQVVEAALVEQAKRYDPDQLRRSHDEPSTPGASCTTENPGPAAGEPTSPTRSRCATTTTNASTTPPSTTATYPRAPSDTADAG